MIRNFNNAETMVAALRRGEIDAAHAVTGAAFDRLEGDDGIEIVEGNQGAFNEFAINGGDGLKKGHPALERPGRARGDRATRSTSRRSSTASRAATRPSPTRSARRRTRTGCRS